MTRRWAGSSPAAAPACTTSRTRSTTSARRSRSWQMPEPTSSTTSRGRACSASRSHSSIRTPSTVFSRRWCPVADAERVRIEIAFDGGQIMGALVTPESADSLEQALGSAELRAGTGEAALALDAEDGRYTIALQRVVYVKRFARESRVGFGAAAP